MADIYVRKTGNDTSGDGTTALPYLTIAKAESVAAAGDTVIIGDGEYIENNGSGVLIFDQNYASPTVYRSESGIKANVRLRASTSRIAVSGSNIVFQGITFVGVSGQGFLLRLQGATVANVRIVDCDFLVASSGTVQIGLSSDFSVNGGDHPGIEVIGCNFRQIGYQRAIGIFFDCGSTGGTVTNLLIQQNTVRVAGYAVRLGQGIINAYITGNDLVSFNPSGVTDHCLLLGVDGATGALSSGAIIANRLWCAHGHTLIVGAGVKGAEVVGNTVGGGVNSALDLGVVVKQAQNVSVRTNTIDARSAAALYFKGAEDCEAYDNDIMVRRDEAGSGIRVEFDNGNSDPCARLTIRRNRVRAFVGKVLDYGGAGSDSGGSIVDENVYEVNGAATLGLVYGNNVTSIRGARMAWGGYDRPNNDRNSRIGAGQAVYAGSPLATL